ncbi:TetR family transcriptional regulator [soil metagenome]
MAWDTEKTKALLLDAATAEFSTYGLAGARIDRIAAQAGVNKERIYQYFGKKDELFGIVLARELAAVMDAVSMSGSGIDTITDYAAQCFDYQVQNPQLARLIFWEGLERSEPVAEAFRSQRSEAKVARLRESLPALSHDDARDLLLTVLTLCDSWQVLGLMDRVYTGATSRDARRDAERKRTVVAAVGAIARDLLERPRTP